MVITDFVPYPPHSGGTSRVYGLVSNLCKRHEVIVVAPIRTSTDPEGISHLESLGIKVEAARRPEHSWLGKAIWVRLKAIFSRVPMHWVLTWDDAIVRTIASAVLKYDPDIIQIEHLSTCRFYSALKGSAKLVLDEHNLESALEADVAKSLGLSVAGILRRREARKVPAFERSMLSMMDLVVAVSDIDRGHLQQMAPDTKVITISNGVDLAFFSDAGFSESKTIVFTGTLDYPPNVEAAQVVAREILPLVREALPDVTAKIIGRRPVQAVRELAGDGLEIIGDVPDIRPYIENAAVVIVPLQSGSGTRLKILEAMAIGKAIVSTSKGAEGLAVTDGVDIILRDDPQGFAEAVVELLNSPDKRKELGANARKTVELKYGYPTLAQMLEQEFCALIRPDSKQVCNTDRETK